jgi:hypothetical protein
LSEDRKSATNAARGRQSVTWHPLFPAAVAVWFGALFGLGTLAIRVSLIERLAVASGIDRLIPAATPPLGITARVLIALALAMFGGIIGAVIGRLVARSKPAARARRAAAAAEAAAAEASEVAPAATAPFAGAPTFIDFSQLDLDDEHKIEPAEPESAGAPAEATPTPRERARQFQRPLDPVTFPLPESFPVPGGAAAQRLNAADLDSLSHLELIERLALSLQKRREEGGDATGEVLGEAAGPSEEPAGPVPALEVPSYYPPAPEPLARRFAVPQTAGEPTDDDATQTGTQPVALFPTSDAVAVAAPRRDSAGTERALREALAALQRMSGAA